MRGQKRDTIIHGIFRVEYSGTMGSLLATDNEAPWWKWPRLHFKDDVAGGSLLLLVYSEAR